MSKALLLVSVVTALSCASGSTASDGSVAPEASVDARPVTDARSDSSVSAEICNFVDDDGDNMCDERVANCRVPVLRGVRPSDGAHMWALTAAEITSAGYTVERNPTFFVYREAPRTGGGIFELKVCRKANNLEFITVDVNCEGPAQTFVRRLGFVGSSTDCGAVGVYRMFKVDPGDHYLTPEMAERTAAEAMGYVLEFTSMYAWLTP